MPPTYRKLQLYAIAISVLSVFYNGAEGAVSIGFGAKSSSRSLVFFGIQSGVEVASSLIVLWRFRNVAKPGEERKAKLDPNHLRFEKASTLTIGLLMLILALGTIATAISVLVLHERPEISNASLIISSTALVLMILIWLPKRYLARELNSSSMQGEATCSLSCIQITIVLFIGSLLYRVWRGGWWVDGAISIVLGILFGWESRKMIKWARDPAFDGGCCGSCQPQDVEARGVVEGSGEGNEKEESEADSCECCKVANDSDKIQVIGTSPCAEDTKAASVRKDDCCVSQDQGKGRNQLSSNDEIAANNLSDQVDTKGCCSGC